MHPLAIRAIGTLTVEQITPLIIASETEGHNFVRRLWDEYASGENRFDSEGSVLFGVFDGEELVAIGGLHRDPYVDIAGVARIRHVYVAKGYRRSGVGRRLMAALIEHARGRFGLLTLRTMTEEGAAFYSSLGFRSDPLHESATHWLRLRLSL
ncbi:MAG: GNAT family N-acetyltransferase [Chloroflexi bacterium]|nr:GNAT family N-acetyltransferase [Chloroflexota bacterium]